MLFGQAQAATNAVVESGFNYLISLVESSLAYRTITTDGWVMKYTMSLEDEFYYEFTSNPVVEVLTGNYLTVTTYNDWVNGINHQCAGFAKVVSTLINDSVTGEWVKGAAFNASSPPPKGAVLATFATSTAIGQEGGYTALTPSKRHTLIYWGKVGSDYYVIDQNWSLDGKVRKHKIPLNPVNSSSPYQSALANYNIVQY